MEGGGGEERWGRVRREGGREGGEGSTEGGGEEERQGRG